MKAISKFILIVLGCMALFGCNKKNAPISLHPDNPHYFLFRGKPTVLIGSTEHYGAVLNLDFDYIRYLDELASKKLNVTRTFTGVYVEPKGAFGIADNTLAPVNGKLICPWARSEEPGYAAGGNKFDLQKWDEAYFARLKDFVAEAGKRNIVVELDLFSNIYSDLQWGLSPLYHKNNINNVPVIEDQKEVLSLKHPELLKIQYQMVEKIVSELNEFDNLYFEICNEPYFGDIAALNEWENAMISHVAGVLSKLPNKQLISQNIANGSAQIKNPHPAVSIFNFHYAKPPVTVEMNYALNKPIGDNETGFNGIDDVTYRTEAWDFLVAGGSLYNNLDYSFTTSHPDGSFVVAKGQPGGGGVALRTQLQILKSTMDELDFIGMKPSNSIFRSSLPGSATLRALAREGQQYLIYLNNAQSENTNYSLRYNGFLMAPLSGKYLIYTVSDDGVKLYLNDRLMINNWTDHGATTDSVFADLKAGEKIPIIVEFYQAGGGAELSLMWSKNGNKAENVPLSSLIAPDGKTPGLMLEKFGDKELKRKVGEMVVSKIDASGIAITDQQKNNFFEFSIDLPAGNFSGEWIDPVSGKRNPFTVSRHPGGIYNLKTPVFSEDMALLIRKI
jgi:hypothetical protein